MKTRIAFLVVALAAVGLAPAARAEEPTIESILQSKSPSVVCVKFVLKMSFSQRGGMAQEQELNREARGVVVDAGGLVMLSNGALEGGGGQRGMMRRMNIEVKASATDFKVLFSNDAKEHDAVLVARDSTLGLAYVQVLAPEGKIAVAELGKGGEPRVGQTLVGITRKGRGFDCAPVIDRLFVSGVVEKPRRMWSVSGAFGGVGLPVYDLGGNPVGVLSTQSGSEGVEEGGGAMGMLDALSGGAGGEFVLPLDAVGKSVEAAKKRAPEAIAKAKEAAAPEAGTDEAGMDEPAMDEPAMGADAPKPPDAPK